MEKIAQFFKALSDETRLRILALLASGELCVCDLIAVLKLPQSKVSRHLAYLRHSGLVEDRRQGVWMYYRLASEDEGIRLELLRLLGTYLPEMPQAREDSATLKRYLGLKESSICS